MLKGLMLAVALGFAVGASDAAQTKLNPVSQEPIIIQFKNLPLADVCGMLAKTTGIEIRFSEGVDTAGRITGELSGATIEQALDYIVALANVRYRVIDAKTVMVTKRDASER